MSDYLTGLYRQLSNETLLTMRATFESDYQQGVGDPEFCQHRLEVIRRELLVRGPTDERETEIEKLVKRIAEAL